MKQLTVLNVAALINYLKISEHDFKSKIFAPVRNKYNFKTLQIMKRLDTGNKLLSKGVLLIMILFGNLYSNAQNLHSTSDIKEFKQAINFCPLAIAFGIYSMNYERLLNEHHGILIRGDYESVPNNYSQAQIDVSGKAAILNYRYHIKGGLNSFFVGAFSRYRVYNGDGNLNGTTFDFKNPEYTIGANLGKRWILKNGLNLNLVWGYGFFMDKLDSSNSQKEILESIGTFQNEYDLYNGMYGEFSIGYAF